MKTITFFSYKGGNGRTLTAANFAVYLTKLGLRVVIMDFDLDAPGVDSKFPEFSLPKGQVGLTDYVLAFQREGGPPGPIENIYCTIPIKSPRQECTLGLIPAGDYLAPDYPAKLNELSWSTIFSPRRDGVAFFQLFLEKIENELKPDVLVIDSRTGFNEIGGLCTQQLADETVMLSSLASESIKMTRQLAQAIRDSEIAKQLNKKVDTKIVICRVPKPRDIDKLKSKCCKIFDIDETKLFFLFSCRGLEQDEFVAMMDTRKEEGLVAGYIQLFRGLNVEVAERSIREEIERTEKGLLSCTVDEADARIREMVALYPHPDVYRRAMRFFNLRRRPEEASALAIRLLDVLPDDDEANLQMAKFLLRGEVHLQCSPEGEVVVAYGGPNRFSRKLLDYVDASRLKSITHRAYGTGQLAVGEKVRLADILEDLGELERSLEIAKECLASGEIEDSEIKYNAMRIAARTAIKLGRKEEGARLVSEIPISQLRGSLVEIAVQQKVEAGDNKAGFELVKILLSQDLDHRLIPTAFSLATQLGRRKELEELVRTHPQLKSGRINDPELVAWLERLGMDMSDLPGKSMTGRRMRGLG